MVTEAPIWQDDEPIPRCCRSHPDWKTLTDHLLDDFAELSPADTLAQLSAARAAVSLFGLSEREQIDTAELIARNQLSMLAGRVGDVARLDPQVRRRA